ncbi:MAG: DNA repair exonuclease [Deferrisomatales bacterium]|nr:DNA repair exonuclease [Deferrisomatales bacterium]
MRFLHTADLQLGLKLSFVAGENGSRARSQRFDTLRRIAGTARDAAVQAVVIAGDLFDDNSVGPETIQQARDALETFAPIPVLILPGNHDAATEYSALARMDAPGHVRILNGREPVEVEGGTFFPCPLARRHETRDPTAWLPAREPGDERVRVAVAHGGVIEFSESSESPNLIDAEEVIAKGFDYLALGDWHGTFRYGDRVWYPGTPEPTHWREKEPGNVLIVELPAAGVLPKVTPVAVGRTSWLEKTVTFEHDQDVETLEKWFAGLGEKSWTLVRLSLDGHLSLGARVDLDRVLEHLAERLLCLQIREDRVTVAPTEADIQALVLEGFVGDAVEQLRAEGSRESDDALRLLYRLRRDVGGDR